MSTASSMLTRSIQEIWKMRQIHVRLVVLGIVLFSRGANAEVATATSFAPANTNPIVSTDFSFTTDSTFTSLDTTESASDSLFQYPITDGEFTVVASSTTEESGLEGAVFTSFSTNPEGACFQYTTATYHHLSTTKEDLRDGKDILNPKISCTMLTQSKCKLLSSFLTDVDWDSTLTCVHEQYPASIVRNTSGSDLVFKRLASNHLPHVAPGDYKTDVVSSATVPRVANGYNDSLVILNDANATHFGIDIATSTLYGGLVTLEQFRGKGLSIMGPQNGGAQDTRTGGMRTRLLAAFQRDAGIAAATRARSPLAYAQAAVALGVQLLEVHRGSSITWACEKVTPKMANTPRRFLSLGGTSTYSFIGATSRGVDSYSPPRCSNTTYAVIARPN